MRYFANAVRLDNSKKSLEQLYVSASVVPSAARSRHFPALISDNFSRVTIFAISWPVDKTSLARTLRQDNTR
jgi:hypothetical protein